jgi:transaldolase
MDAVADHGEIDGDNVTGTAEAAAEAFELLSGVGIDVDDVFLTLEREGVEKFEASWTELLGEVGNQLAQAKG